jgi:hypothetical protein
MLRDSYSDFMALLRRIGVSDTYSKDITRSTQVLHAALEKISRVMKYDDNLPPDVTWERRQVVLKVMGTAMRLRMLWFAESALSDLGITYDWQSRAFKKTGSESDGKLWQTGLADAFGHITFFGYEPLAQKIIQEISALDTVSGGDLNQYTAEIRLGQLDLISNLDFPQLLDIDVKKIQQQLLRL